MIASRQFSLVPFLVLAISTNASAGGLRHWGVTQPATYTSPSGEYALAINPEERNGNGGARYRFTHKGEHVWERIHNYTLRGIEVTDMGHVVGVAYRSVPVDRSKIDYDPEEFMHVVILSPSGRELLNEKSLRHDIHHAASQPFVEQLLVDADNDRVVVRSNGREKGNPCDAPFGYWENQSTGPWWFVYRLSTGEKLDEFRPDKRFGEQGKAYDINAVQLIAGTPLLLVHWLQRGGEHGWDMTGARLLVVELSGAKVWVLDLANDYANIEILKARNSLSYGNSADSYFESNPPILAAENPRQFALRLFKTNEKVVFSLSEQSGAWNVLEADRQPLNDSSARQAAGTTVSPKPLPLLGELTLTDMATLKPQFAPVYTFAPDSHGNFWVVRRDGGEQSTLLKVARNGTTLKMRNLSPANARGQMVTSETARHNDDSIYAIRATDETHKSFEAVRIELESGKETQFPSYPGGYGTCVSRFPDGAFLVIDHDQQSFQDRITMYDKSGKLLWQWNYDELHRNLRDVMIPKYAAALDDEVVAILGTSRIFLVNRRGEVSQTIDLVSALDRDESGGHTGTFNVLVADGNDGFFVGESRNPPVLVHYNSAGERTSRWSPRHTDGRTFDIRCVRVDHEKRIWISDGESIMRLTDDGIVDLVIGRTPDPSALRKIVGFTVDRNGQLYAASHGTGAVHVFDRQGLHLRVLNPAPDDFAGTVEQTVINVDDDGTAFVQMPKIKLYGPPTEYLKFSANGERVGPVSLLPGIGTGQWHDIPNAGHRIGISHMYGDDKLIIVDRDSNIVSEQKKRPNGEWFEQAHCLSVGSDGRIALLHQSQLPAGKNWAIDLFHSDGTPDRTLALPTTEGRYLDVALGSDRCIVIGTKAAVIVNLAEGAQESWELPQPAEGWIHREAFLLPGEEELIVYENTRYGGAGEARIYRYELP